MKKEKSKFEKKLIINFVVVDLIARKCYTATDAGGVSRILGISWKDMNSVLQKHGKFIVSKRFIIAPDPIHVKSIRGSKNIMEIIKQKQSK